MSITHLITSLNAARKHRRVPIASGYDLETGSTPAIRDAVSNPLDQGSQHRKDLAWYSRGGRHGDWDKGDSTIQNKQDN